MKSSSHKVTKIKRNTKWTDSPSIKPTPITMNILNQPPIQMTIEGYDWARKYRDKHLLFAFSSALTAIRETNIFR